MLESLAIAAVTGAVTAAAIIGALRSDITWLKEIAQVHERRIAGLEKRPAASGR